MVLQYTLVHMILILWPIYPLASSSSSSCKGVAQPDCKCRCGDVEIPYPFGMNDPKCYLDRGFLVECRNNDSSPFHESINVEIKFIDYDFHVVQINSPVYHWGCPNTTDSTDAVIDLKGSPFVFSQENNKFVAISCNNLILMSNDLEVGGCVSICGEEEEKDKKDLEIRDGCSGRQCCQTVLPKYLSEYNPTWRSIQEITFQSLPDECSYALIGDRDWLNGGKRVSEIKRLDYVPATLEWEILNFTSQLADTICFETNITSSDKNHLGRRCKCNDGFRGNPYVSGGCTHFSNGSDFTIGANSKARDYLVIVFTSLGSILFIFGVWRSYRILRRRRKKKRKNKYFKQNGGLLLQRRSSAGEVFFDKTKLFSLKDLEKATDRFSANRVLGNGGQGTVYKGMLVDGQIVAVKKFKVQGNVEDFINEVLILSQINHRNVVKLLGFCLETQVPLLVYEFIPNGNLFQYLHDQNDDLPMTWEMRLRIASEVAGALFYLHSAASQPIYHRDVKSTNILLDEKYRAKIADFGSSRMVSVEDTHLTTLVQGTFGYLDPEYFQTSQFTEKSDVYSFGVVLVELLTGERPISSSSTRPEEAKSLASYFIMCMEEERLIDILDRRTMEGEMKDIMGVANLAKRCLELNGRKRPTMKEVTMELQGIQKLGKRCNSSQRSYEEAELAGIKSYHCQPWAVMVSSTGSSATIEGDPHQYSGFTGSAAVEKCTCSYDLMLPTLPR